MFHIRPSSWTRFCSTHEPDVSTARKTRLQNKVKNYETEAVGLVRASFSVHRSFEGSEVTD